MRPFALLVLVFVSCGRPPPKQPAPRPDCPHVPQVPDGHELIDRGDVHAKVEGGDAYVLENGKWKYVMHLYEPDWFETAYAVDEQCAISMKAPDGTRVPVRRELSESFEGLSHVRELMGIEHGFTTMTLQSPLAREVADYVKLRACIFDGTCDFRDARLDVASGTLRATSTPPSAGMQTSKSSIESGIAYFAPGDDFWFAASYRLVAGGALLTLVDLESDYLDSGPGPRVRLFEDGTLGVELKSLDKPVWRQTVAPFPIGTWVRVAVHYSLRADETGVIQLWQDGVQVLDARGRTMPIADTVLDRVEIGISANGFTATDTVLDVDDVVFSASRLPELP